MNGRRWIRRRITGASSGSEFSSGMRLGLPVLHGDQGRGVSDSGGNEGLTAVGSGFMGRDCGIGGWGPVEWWGGIRSRRTVTGGKGFCFYFPCFYFPWSSGY